jgi:hypothetical protein
MTAEAHPSQGPVDKIQRNIKLVRENITTYGLQAGLHDITRRAIGRVVDFRILQCIELTLNGVDAQYLAPDPSYDRHFLTEKELLAFSKDPALDLDEPFIRDALGKGDRCFGILQDGKMASYGWYSQRPTDMSSELVFHFDPSSIYMYKGLTLHAFRGKRLHAVGMALALEAYTKEGARGIVSNVESNNFASLRSCYRLGYTDIGKVYIVRLNGRYRTHATGNCAERGVWVEGRDPVPGRAS